MTTEDQIAGVLAHEGGTILVVANSLRLLMLPGLRRKAEPKPPKG